MNDFEAVGYGVPELRDNDIITLHDVPAHPKVGALQVQLGVKRACLSDCSLELPLAHSSLPRTVPMSARAPLHMIPLQPRYLLAARKGAPTGIGKQ